MASGQNGQINNSISSLVNIDQLRGKLSSSHSAKTILPKLDAYYKIQIEWPDALKQNHVTHAAKLLKTNINPNTQPVEIAQPNEATDNAHLLSEPEHFLTQLFDILHKDVFAARDKLIALNPGRRTLVERRLEYIARKIARLRGERFQKTLSLTEILKETFRESNQSHEHNTFDFINSSQPHKSLGFCAWEGFVAEVALYHMLELFLLKSLDATGWRTFDSSDLTRMNYAAHSFLTQKASGFAHDKHAWNFVRSNLYSWHTLSSQAIAEISALFSTHTNTIAWDDKALNNWLSTLSSAGAFKHLNFAQEAQVANQLMDFIQNELNLSFVTSFQGQSVNKKVFLPTLELGGIALALLDNSFEQLGSRLIPSDEFFLNQSTHTSLQRAIWTCDSESFEVFWTEVISLLKTIHWSHQKSLNSVEKNELFRLPHLIHAVHMLGLELHNLDQLSLDQAGAARIQQGSAGQIQQLETFDFTIVTDHPDRAKSGRWMNALATQLPYWKNVFSSNSNLNWGELHLYLGLSKLKERGYCIYLSHRMLPDSGDGDKLRRALLNQSVFETLIELDDTVFAPYKYMYVFRKSSNKQERDHFHPKFGKHSYPYEEANSTQAEIAERGWDHLFVRGAAPLVRHLNQKFPKLFQIANIQNYNSDVLESNAFDGLFSQPKSAAARAKDKSAQNFIELKVLPDHFQFLCPIKPEVSQLGRHSKDKLLIFPHNPLDVNWIKCLLNSPPAQFWIKHQIILPASGKHLKLQEIKSLPVLDLTLAPTNAVHDAINWIAQTHPQELELKDWACHSKLNLTEKQIRYVALAHRHASLDRIIQRYGPLFHSLDSLEFKAEAIPSFYPEQFLNFITQCPLVRIQYYGREQTPLLPENWTIHEVNSVKAEQNSYVIITTKQGPQIQIYIPSGIEKYLYSQLKELRETSWGEALSLLRVPKNINLFVAQTTEISRVMLQTMHELKIYENILNQLTLDLFEISPELRQFL